MDPFDVFGNDDDDSDDSDERGNPVAQSLVDTVNRRKELPESQKGNRPPSVSDTNDNDSIQAIESKQISLRWKDPLYLGPVVLVSGLLEFGGGRGYVAGRNLPAGSLVMVEEPMITWRRSSSQGGRPQLCQMVIQILESVQSEDILNTLEHFYPTKASVDGEDRRNNNDPEQVSNMLESLKSDDSLRFHLEHMLEIVQSRNITNSDGSALTSSDCFRLILALQYNGLQSGLYPHGAMLNHSDQPNCVKFFPSQDRRYSEVRTTRMVTIGEPLTISYVPQILSHASRRHYLWNQHRFDIGADVKPSLRQMELIHSRLPQSSIERPDENCITCRIEKAVSELRDLLEEFNAANASDMSQADPIKALEQTSMELCQQAADELQNDCHILRIPCLELHLDSADLAQRRIPTLSSSQRLLLLSRMTVTAIELLKLKGLLLGEDHFDLARHNLDLATAIEEILSRSPKHLIQLGMNGYENAAAWNSLANQARREYNRIKSLYPYDADRFHHE